MTHIKLFSLVYIHADRLTLAAINGRSFTYNFWSGQFLMIQIVTTYIQITIFQIKNLRNKN